jgi:hypothetical protein
MRRSTAPTRPITDNADASIAVGTTQVSAADPGSDSAHLIISFAAVTLGLLATLAALGRLRRLR